MAAAHYLLIRAELQQKIRVQEEGRDRDWDGAATGGRHSHDKGWEANCRGDQGVGRQGLEGQKQEAGSREA